MPAQLSQSAVLGPKGSISHRWVAGVMGRAFSRGYSEHRRARNLLGYNKSMPSLNTRLESSPLVLRLPTSEDVDQITELCQDAEIARWTRVPSPYSRTDAEVFVEFAQEEAASGRGAHFSVVHQERIIGSCGLPRVDWADLTGEVGYWMGAGWRGKGFTTLAARAVCQWSFDVLGLERLELTAAAPNASSNAVAVKLGFRREGVARSGAIVGHTGTPGAPRVDVNTYGLLTEEFRSLQAEAS